MLISPNEKIMEQYILEENGIYGMPYIYNDENVFNSYVLPDFKITMNDMFS